MTVNIVVPTSGSLLRGTAVIHCLRWSGWPLALASGTRLRRRERRTYDSGLVAEMCRSNLRIAVQQRREIREPLADGAAQDEEVRPEERLHPVEIDVDAVHPRAPIEVLHRLHVRGGVLLRVHAIQLHVAELGVGEKPAVNEERRADAGAERQHDYRACHSPAGTQTHLRQARRIGIVEEERITIECAPDQGGT